ncbi:MAG: hypothetical protein Devi2KO_39470 [Devosia indica]
MVGLEKGLRKGFFFFFLGYGEFNGVQCEQELQGGFDIFKILRVNGAMGGDFLKKRVHNKKGKEKEKREGGCVCETLTKGTEGKKKEGVLRKKRMHQ